MTEANVQVPEGAEQQATSPEDVTEVRKGLGGRSTTGEPEASAAKPTTSTTADKPDERYAAAQLDRDRVIKVRDGVGGRNKLAALLSVTGSAVWRAENGKLHPDEVEPFDEALKAVEGDLAAGKYASQAKGKRNKLSVILEAVVEVAGIIDEVNELNKNQKLVPFLAKASRILADAQK